MFVQLGSTVINLDRVAVLHFGHDCVTFTMENGNVELIAGEGAQKFRRWWERTYVPVANVAVLIPAIGGQNDK